MPDEKVKYTLTPEHKLQLKPWADKWIKIAMSTTPMSADDKLDCVKYVGQLYEAAELKKPKYVLYVRSPVELSIIGGFAAAIAELGEKSKYTILEMVDIVEKSILNKKSTPKHDKWIVHPYDINALNEVLELGKTGKECIKKVHFMWNGGNQLAGWISYVSFFRHIAKLDIDYSKWDCYEKLGSISGPRVMHELFCIISDLPTHLTANSANQPHNSTDAFCKWSDGTSLFQINGVRVPAHVVLNPGGLTVEDIETQTNAEVRRIMTGIYGTARYIIDSKSEIVSSDDFGILYKKEQPGDEVIMMVKVVNSTPEPDGSYKDYFIRCDPNAYGGLKTARAAVASTWRNKDGSLLFKTPEEYMCDVET